MGEFCCSSVDGKQCEAPASHKWGPLHYCCDHFDRLVVAMFEIRNAVAEEHHKRIVREFEERAKQSSRILGTQCKADANG